MTEEEVVEQFIPIITKKAAKYAAIAAGKGLICEYDDFYSVGMMAAVEAHRGLDTDKAGLVTRAFSLIDFRMKSEINSAKPHSMAHQNFVLRYFRAIRELGEDATDAQIIKWSNEIHKHPSTRITKVNLPFLKNLVKYRQFSVDAPYKSDYTKDEVKFELPDKGRSVADLVMENEQKRALYKEIAKLPERPREVLKRRLAEETLQEIAETYGLSRERIRQIEAKYLPLVCERLKRRLVL